MRKVVLLLCAGVLGIALASACLAGSYSAICPIPFNGASTNRGIAVNKNAGSAYYGYFYGIDSVSVAVRIWKPNSGGTGATAYTDTLNKLSYVLPNPTGTLLMHVFVGPDDKVWVADFGAKQICVGPPDGAPGGGNLTVVIDSTKLTFKPRGIYVSGNYGAAGTRVYVAEYESASNRNCEVFEFDGTNWNRIANLGHLNLVQPWFVTVDSSGNSYWASFSTAAPQVKKVLPTWTEDLTWVFTKPAFFGASWLPGGIAYVHDPSDLVNPDVLYISAYSQTSCSRYNMSGVYIDGYGNTSGMIGSPPPGTWTSFALSGPGGNSTVRLTADDARNTYLLVNYPGAVQAYKFHLQNAPQPPTGLQGSNDIYGQIRLKWNPPAPSPDAPTGYKVYRGLASGAEAQYATTGSYPKWKDSAQGQSPGTFYYYVTSFNGAGESGSSNEVGPISVVASTAPAPRTLGLALCHSELNEADTVNNPAFVRDWELVDEFLTDRSVAYTKVYDADPVNLNIENDDIAGCSLLILGPHRDMSSYTAQCIADYCNYSRGRVLADYNSSIADHTGTRQTDFLLKDVYRLNASNMGSGGSPWVADPKYRYLKPIAGAPEAATIFAGLAGPPGWDGAQQWNFNNYLVRAYADGTASEVGKWYDSSGNQSIIDPDDVGLVVGYTNAAKTDVQSVYTGSYWWSQARGAFSACTLLENILTFFGVSFTPPSYDLTIGDAKLRTDTAGVILVGKVVTRTMMQQIYEPGLQAVRIDSVFYVEQSNRSGGIKVQVPAGYTVSEGDVVDIAGQITNDRVQTSPAGQPLTYAKFERWITPIEFKSASGGTIPDFLYVGNRSVGGGTRYSQLGVAGGVGLNNVGLLVKVVGSLTQDTQTDTSGNSYFLIDDGSGYQIPSEPVKGIKVLGTSPTSVLGSMIETTGAIGAEYDVDHQVPPVPTNAIVPIIRTSATDAPRVIP